MGGSHPIDPLFGPEKYMGRNKEILPEHDMELQLGTMTYM